MSERCAPEFNIWIDSTFFTMNCEQIFNCQERSALTKAKGTTKLATIQAQTTFSKYTQSIRKVIVSIRTCLVLMKHSSLLGHSHAVTRISFRWQTIL